jgi:RNA polymerase sigma factor (sigma-70 family)
MNDQVRHDAELTAGAGSSDFEDFFARYAREIASIVALTTRDVFLAEDATQEAMTRAFQRWDHVGGLARPDLWVIGVATRVAIDAWRKRRREVGLAGANEPSRSVDVLQPLMLRWGLEHLTPQERLLIILRHRDGLSTEEIGRLLGRSTNTVAIYLKRARRRLRTLLSGAEPWAR